jgi:acyl-coenzyme A thioesterase PaaI-like protein
MLKRILIAAGIVLIAAIAYVLYVAATTKNHSPNATATYEGSTLSIAVDYCRPYKKGRLIFGTEEEGALQPYGKKWRTGANEATEIEFSESVMIAGIPVKKGRYSIYSIPGKTQWTIAFNSNLDYWGISPFYDVFDESKDVTRIAAPALTSMETVEQFTIEFEEIMDNNAVMLLKWDQTEVTIPISKL